MPRKRYDIPTRFWGIPTAAGPAQPPLGGNVSASGFSVLRGCPEILKSVLKSVCWQSTMAAHPVPQTLQKQGVPEIIWLQAGTARRIFGPAS